MILINLTPEKVHHAGNVFNIGQIKKGSDAAFEILMQDEQPIKWSKNRNCGCFKIKPSEEDGKIKVNIKYDTNIVGELSKLINLFYFKEGKEYNIQITVKGKVK